MRAICWSKRSLEILDRLGIGDKAAAKGVTWQVGRTFHRDAEVFAFDLMPEPGHKRPAFVNLQQYYVEEYLIARARARVDRIDLRFRNRVTAIRQADDHATVEVETPDGTYALAARHVIACDGARSPIRDMLGLDFAGELFEERFLIADIEMLGDMPDERHFWFEPPFHPGQSALMHKQPDHIYRIDLQLGWDADPEAEKRPENVIPRIERVVGHRDFRLDWVSVYSFQCRRLASFVHGRVLFAGDSAHIVSPFGARGGEMIDMVQRDERVHLEFKIPSRGVMGLRTRILNATRGEATLYHHFSEYGPFRGDVGSRQNGSLISMSTDKAVAYALDALQQRGTMFVKPGDQCYEGMVVGEHAKAGDLVVNIAKATKRTAGRQGPQTLYDLIQAQGNLVYRVLDATMEAFAKSDLELARKLEDLDEPIDHLYKQFFRELGRLHDEDDIEWASSMVLASRYLERIADNAVDIGERIAYLVTGEFDGPQQQDEE